MGDVTGHGGWVGDRWRMPNMTGGGGRTGSSNNNKRKMEGMAGERAEARKTDRTGGAECKRHLMINQ